MVFSRGHSVSHPLLSTGKKLSKGLKSRDPRWKKNTSPACGRVGARHSTGAKRWRVLHHVDSGELNIGRTEDTADGTWVFYCFGNITCCWGLAVLANMLSSESGNALLKHVAGVRHDEIAP